MKKKFVEGLKDLTLDIPNIVETTIQQNEDELAIAEELLDYETSEEVKKKLLVSTLLVLLVVVLVALVELERSISVIFLNVFTLIDSVLFKLISGTGDKIIFLISLLILSHLNSVNKLRKITSWFLIIFTELCNICWDEDIKFKYIFNVVS